MTSALAPVYLVHGEDEALVSQALTTVLGALEEAGIATSAIEEYAAAGRDEPVSLAAVTDACRTPPFLTEYRVVVARDLETLDAAGIRALAECLAEPLDTTVFVGCLARDALPKTLRDRLPAGSVVVNAAPGRGARAVGEWFAARVEQSGVQLSRDALAALRAHLGEDLARLDGLLATLEAAYGSGARIGPAELEAYLGSAGGVAPWDLTDAIDKADIAGALEALHRMLAGGERHPLQVLATLHRHYQAMLRLDGAPVHDEAGAAALTHLAPFPAGKALRQARQLGHDRIVRAIRLLAAADLGLRGTTGLSPEIVMEVLVARLSQNSRVAAGRPRPRERAAR